MKHNYCPNCGAKWTRRKKKMSSVDICVLFGMLFIIAIELKIAINKLNDLLDYFLKDGE